MWNLVGDLSFSFSLSLSLSISFCSFAVIIFVTRLYQNCFRLKYSKITLSTHTVQINLTEQWCSTIHEGPRGLVKGPFRVRSGRGCCRWWSAVESPGSTTKHCKMHSDLYSDLFFEIYFGGLGSKSDKSDMFEGF